MPGSSNIVQWNPAAANQETDAQYLADSMRSGGATDPSIFASILANKAFYQWSTVITALATMMANKGYTISDANLPNLVNALSNILTNADLANSPALGAGSGTGPTAPNQSLADNSSHIANCNFVNGNSAIKKPAFGGDSAYIKLPNWLGGFVLQMGTTSLTTSPFSVVFPTNMPAALIATFVSNQGTVLADVAGSGSTLNIVLSSSILPNTVGWLAIGY